jgi:hypothetical protein
VNHSRLVRLAFPVLFVCVGVQAQWLNYHDPSAPKNKDGTINLKAPTPKAPGGKPDLSGVWQHEASTLDEYKRIFGAAYEKESQSALIGMELEVVHKYAYNIFLDRPGPPPLTPAAEAFMKKRAAERNVANVCHGEYGWPILGLLAEPFKIIQTPKVTLILYEIDSTRRQVFTDGRDFPKTFEFPAFLGYSIGRWEGDTFVVESRGFNDRTPLDVLGHPRSENMHITERYHRPDYGHLNIDYTFDDPTFYKEKFTVRINYNLDTENDLFEMFCNENEKDRAHMVK